MRGKFSETGLWITAEEYLRFLRSRNRSPWTISNYRQTLTLLAAAQPDLSVISRPDMDRFFDQLWALYKPASVLHHHKNTRAFLNWCVRHGHLPASPMKGIPEPRVRPNVVEPFSADQVRALYAAAHTARDRAIVAVLLNTGVRISELCRLRRDDVHAGRLRILGKGAKQRWVGLGAESERTLRIYMALQALPTDRVFDIARTTAYWALRRMGARAGVPKTHPHRFRDTFAVRWLENGGGIDDLQVILGHAAIHMTLRYVAYGRAERAILNHHRYAPTVH